MAKSAVAGGEVDLSLTPRRSRPSIADDATQLIQAGAEKVSLNSAAVKNFGTNGCAAAAASIANVCAIWTMNGDSPIQRFKRARMSASGAPSRNEANE